MQQYPLGAVVRPNFEYNYKLSAALKTETYSASLQLEVRLTGEIVEAFLNSLTQGNERAISPQQRVALSILLANAYFSWKNYKLTAEHSAILFNRSNHALKRSRYNRTGVGIRPFRHAVDLMVDAELLTCTKGFRGKLYDKGIASTFRPTSRLCSWFINNEASLMVSPTSKNRELLWLKQGEGFVDYPDQLLQQQYREQLLSINTANTQFNFSYLEYQKVDGKKTPTGKVIKPAPLSIEYNRFFKENWITGGRLYSSMSNISKEERRTLRMNDSPTIELDYGSLHLRMMYAEAGVITPNSDLYAISNYPRDVMKQVALRVANCKSRNEALHSLIRKGHLKTVANEMLTLFEQAHTAIAGHFYKEFWRIGMFIESCIGIQVMTHFAIAGKPILNIHDGFRVKAEDEELLRNCMHKYYTAEVGQEPVIDYD